MELLHRPVGPRLGDETEDMLPVPEQGIAIFYIFHLPPLCPTLTCPPLSASTSLRINSGSVIFALAVGRSLQGRVRRGVLNAFGLAR
eukprot:753200-Hanusia_phi.AAC.5